MTVLAAERFEAYGPSHQGALVLLAVGVVAIVCGSAAGTAGRRWPSAAGG